MEKKQPWFANRWRRILVDMHIPDWDAEFLSKLSPERYVDLMEQGGATSVMVYANSHVGFCLYPTKVGRMHAGLKGRDFFGEVVELCHKRDITVVTYYTLVFNNYAYIEHPDWRATINGWYPPGGPDSSNRYGTCCPNSPYREFALAELEEICGNYDTEGIFLDMTFWPGVCYCQHCVDRHKKEFGTELPNVVNWNDPKWVQFQKARQRWLDEFAAVITKKVRDVNPEMTVTHQFSTVMSDWRFGVPYTIADHSDYLSGDFYGDATQQSVVCKTFHNLSIKKPFEFLTSRCLDLTDHVTMKSLGRMETQAIVAPAHSSAFLFIDAINPDGTLNSGTYKYTRSIFDKLAPYETELGGRLCADVAVYFSFDSKFNPAYNNVPVEELNDEINKMPHWDALTGACTSLRETHVPFDVITKHNIGDLGKYQVLVLSDVLFMDDTEVDAVRNFVKAGGSLYASFRTSATRADGTVMDDFMLADIFGTSWQKTENTGLTFFTPIDKKLIDVIWPQDHAIHLNGQLAIKNRNAETLAFKSLPRTDPDKGDIFGDSFSSIHSNPPASPGTDPAIVSNKFGKGHVIYAAGALEAVGYDVNKRVFAHLIEMLLQRPTWFKAEAHKSLEFVLFGQPDRKRMLLSILQTNPDMVGVGLDVQFSVKVPEGFTPQRLLKLPDNQIIEHSVEKGYLTADVKGIDTFAMFAIEYK